LGDIGKSAKPAVPVLIEALKDSSVRDRAVYALGEIGDPRAIEPLEEVAKNDPDSHVRSAAAQAIEKIKEAVQKK
jgi:HEAT repeat protein